MPDAHATCVFIHTSCLLAVQLMDRSWPQGFSPIVLPQRPTGVLVTCQGMYARGGESKGADMASTDALLAEQILAVLQQDAASGDTLAPSERIRLASAACRPAPSASGASGNASLASLFATTPTKAVITGIWQSAPTSGPMLAGAIGDAHILPMRLTGDEVVFAQLLDIGMQHTAGACLSPCATVYKEYRCFIGTWCHTFPEVLLVAHMHASR